ncbi:helix-turn-helix transcriptional regulator [Roseibacillus persicicus]|uniref:helix-turn-helix transcriptional regulator n=1 Tax=Roseibacillus persicicus TaxID=454148 RepID=UPI00280EEDD4|nr:AraC family transcriptional regulator [Roseibacillus persicicus]MDQ8188992.1 AraC family transcriptional regulator [Roseibacillus persicicus]
MKKDSTHTHLLEKVFSSSLFQTYAGAFQDASGLKLGLVASSDSAAIETAELKVPVSFGRQTPLMLVAGQAGEETAKGELCLGLLEAFAMQLGDEINRILLADSGNEPAVVKGAKGHIRSNLASKFCLDDLAAGLQVCPFHLCRVFKEHTGLTMTEYGNRLRVERARRLLSDPGAAVSEVADEVGFSSLSQFNRTFLKYAGESPSEYRARLDELEHCILHAA